MGVCGMGVGSRREEMKIEAVKKFSSFWFKPYLSLVHCPLVYRPACFCYERGRFSTPVRLRDFYTLTPYLGTHELVF